MATRTSNSWARIGEAARDFFGRLFEKSTDSVIGVDIGSSAIKVVQLKRRGGKAVLETYGELALGPYADLVIGQATNLSPEDAADALTDLMREANVTSREGGIAIPLSASLVVVIDMPVSSESELENMVPLEARKYIPVPISEVTLDWRVIPEEYASVSADAAGKRGGASDGKRHAKVLIAAIHNETISRYQSIAEQSGVDAAFLEIEVFSAIRANVPDMRGTVLSLDIGAGTSKLLIIENGIVVNTHIINRGSQDITFALSRSLNVSFLKAEEMKREIGFSKDAKHKEVRESSDLVMSGIFSEANKMLLAYEKKYNKAVDRVLLSGGGSLLKGIREIANGNFDPPVEHAHPFAQTETPAFLEPTLKEIGPNFSVALGVALRRLQEIE